MLRGRKIPTAAADGVLSAVPPLCLGDTAFFPFGSWLDPQQGLSVHLRRQHKPQRLQRKESDPPIMETWQVNSPSERCVMQKLLSSSTALTETAPAGSTLTPASSCGSNTNPCPGHENLSQAVWIGSRYALCRFKIAVASPSVMTHTHTHTCHSALCQEVLGSCSARLCAAPGLNRDSRHPPAVRSFSSPGGHETLHSSRSLSLSLSFSVVVPFPPLPCLSPIAPVPNRPRPRSRPIDTVLHPHCRPSSCPVVHASCPLSLPSPSFLQAHTNMRRRQMKDQ